MLMLLIIDEEKNIISFIYNKNYKRMLYTSAQILGKERGEEALHDVFVKLIEKFSKNFSDLRDKSALFFVIVVRNHSINILRKEKNETVPLYDETIFTGEPAPEEQVIAKDSEERLIALVRSLDPVMREILEYKYILGYSNQEIAQELGITQTVVSSRINRAKKELRKRIEEKEVSL